MNNIFRDIEELNIYLNEAIERNISNIKFQKELNKAFEKKNLNPKMVKCLFAGTKLVSDMNDMEKMTFANTCYEVLGGGRYNIKYYFSGTKQAEWLSYVNAAEKINDIYCEDFKRINSYEYHGDFTYEQVYKYMKNILWVYYPATQRSSKYREVNEKTIIREVNVNKKSVNEISNLILEGKFEATEIILNCMMVKGKTPKFIFEKKYKEIGDITIKPDYDIDSENYTIVTILDGYHRILGICKAVEQYYEETGEWLQGSISCKLVLADINRAKRIVELVFRRTDDDKNWIKSLEQNDYTEFVDLLIQNSNVLRDNVADIYEQCKYSKKITYKTVLTDTIKKLKVNVANKSTSLFLANDMAKVIDRLFDLIKSSNNKAYFFDKKYNVSNMFIGYLTVAYKFRKEELTVDKYLNIIDVMRKNINENTIKTLKLETKSCSVNKTIEYFDKIMNEVI